MEIFAILFKKNRTYNKLMLGKVGKDKNGTERMGIYTLEVNNTINLKYYYTLLKEGDFSNTNFKIIEETELEKLLENKKDKILKAIFSNKDSKIKLFLKNLLTQ